MDNDSRDLPYNGPEQRREDRRKTVDRRQDVRFEPDKDDRRNSPGRREKDHDPWFRHGV